LEFNVPFQHNYGYIRDEIIPGYKHDFQVTSTYHTRTSLQS